MSCGRVDDLGDLARQAGPGPSRPQRPARRRDHHRRRPDPGQRPDHRRPGRPRRPRGRLRAPRPAEGRAGPGVLASRRWPTRLAELLGRPVAFATDTVGESRDGGRRRRSATATSRCWRTCGSTPARRARTTPSAARSPTSSPRWRDAYVGDGFGAVHRKHASVVRRAASGCRTRPGGWCCAEVEVLRAAHRATRTGPTSSSSAARRSPTSSASSTTCSAGRPAAHRRRHGLHLPQGAGPRGRQEPARGGPARHGARLPRRRRRRRASRSCCRSTSSPRPRSPPTPTHDVVAADAIPADRLGLDIGPESGELFAAKLADARDRLLERPDGRVRDGRRSPSGTRAVAAGAHRGHAAGGLTVVGGGDSAAAVRAARLRRGRRSATSPPAAAPASSSSRARTLPGLAVLEDSALRATAHR